MNKSGSLARIKDFPVFPKDCGILKFEFIPTVEH